jgi:hypothetical protein
LPLWFVGPDVHRRSPGEICRITGGDLQHLRRDLQDHRSRSARSPVEICRITGGDLQDLRSRFAGSPVEICKISGEICKISGPDPHYDARNRALGGSGKSSEKRRPPTTSSCVSLPLRAWPARRRR